MSPEEISPYVLEARRRMDEASSVLGAHKREEAVGLMLGSILLELIQEIRSNSVDIETAVEKIQSQLEKANDRPRYNADGDLIEGCCGPYSR